MTFKQNDTPKEDFERFKREIQHGQYLAYSETENQWGWGTPAGKKRLRRRAMLIAETSALTKNMTVLEVGCGTGLFTEHFAATGCRITAVDISPDLLERARVRMELFDNVRFELRPFEECQDIGLFDAILGSSVLHHLNLDKALCNMFELLKPGGSIVFAEPNHRNPQVFLERKFRRFFPYVSADETAFYRHQIYRDLTKAGFSNIRVVPFDWLHPATPAVIIPFVSGVGWLFEKIPFIREFSGSLLLSAIKPA
jgi:2-polyprenyl-3-methyl-5-hydroxy-6-metoxy-1,4-benzoquinol methylase